MFNIFMPGFGYPENRELFLEQETAAFINTKSQDILEITFPKLIN